jgi:hypothetical protein
MILSIAHASKDEASGAHFYAIWSDMVIGQERPQGLIDCYLLEDEGVVQVAAVWKSVEDHDTAVDDVSHPAFGFFKACGLDPTHATFRIIGHMHQA